MTTPYRTDRAPRFLRMILGPKAATDLDLRSMVKGLRRSGIEVEVRLTWEPGDGQHFAHEALELGCDAVIGAGGDGLVTELVNALARNNRTGGKSSLGSRTALGLLPFGTGNDFATAVGFEAGRPGQALRCVTRGEHRAVDCVEVVVDGHQTRYFLNMATAGFGTRATVETSSEAKRWLGSLSYLVSGLSLAPQLEPVELRVVGPAFSWQGKAVFAAIGNGRTAAGGIPLCPKALADDGQVDLTLLPETPIDELISRVGEKLLQGSLFELESLVEHRAPWIELESDTELQINLDGEPIHGQHFRFEVLEKALEIFAPAGPLFTEPR